MNHPPKDQREPTAEAPPSVEESVYEEAEHAGKSGPNAADPPKAAEKSDDAGGDADVDSDHYQPPLEPDEAADVGETHAEAVEAKGGRQDDQPGEDIISLDTPD